MAWANRGATVVRGMLRQQHHRQQKCHHEVSAGLQSPVQATGLDVDDLVCGTATELHKVADSHLGRGNK